MCPWTNDTPKPLKGFTMKNKTNTSNTDQKDNIINPADVECATDCNEQWQDCQDEHPDKKGVCNTKLAKCVKKCD